MLKMTRVIVLSFFVSAAQMSAAQNLVGVWEGFLNHTSCLDSRQLFNVKLTIQSDKNQYTGVIGYYLLYGNEDFSNVKPLFSFPFSAKFDGQSIAFNYYASQELELNQFMIGYYVLGKYGIALEYRKDGILETLSGMYRGSNGGKGDLKLRRQNEEAITAANNASLIATLRKQQLARKTIQQKPGAQQTVSPKHVWQRSDSLAALYAQEQKTVGKLNLRTDSVFQTIVLPDSLPYITLDLFDNAEIDGDSISVFVNEVLVMHKAVLSAKPIQYRLYKPVSGMQAKVRIVAENLGSIPPNTALAQVTTQAGLQRFLMQSDERTNGVIVFNWSL